MNNPFFDELNKIANTVEETVEPMNPDPHPKKTTEDAETAQAKNVEEKDNEKKADELDEFREKIAGSLTEFGTLAKIIEFSQGEESDLQKEAQSRLDALLTDEESYVEVITKSASELFSNEDNLNQLHSDAGILYTAEKLADFFESEEFEKVAADGESFSAKVRDAGSNLVKSVRDAFENAKNLETIGIDLENAKAELETTRQLATQDLYTNGAGSSLVPQVAQLDEQVDHLSSQQLSGRVGKGAKWAGLAGGAALGGKMAYDAVQHYRNPEVPEEEVAMQQTASENIEEIEKSAKVLSEPTGDDKLKSDNKIDYDGGTDKMSKELVQDFLKIAGAAGLVTIVNDESLDLSLRKEASDRFDAISELGKSAMGEEFIKVAQEIYSEEQLHEVVAGQHTDELFEKVAFFTDSVPEMSVGELEKVANAGGVAAKGVSGSLTDAKANIQATIEEEKKKAEGQGRQYVGDLASTGKAGGGLVGGKEGYNVTNNTGKYDVDKTAHALEEAYLTKQAATEAYFQADRFIRANQR